MFSQLDVSVRRDFVKAILITLAKYETNVENTIIGHRSVQIMISELSILYGTHLSKRFFLPIYFLGNLLKKRHIMHKTNAVSFVW